MDKGSHPELSLGSVDFLVNEDYCIRNIQEPIYVFAIDISHKAIANGVTLSAIRAVSAALQRLRIQEAKFRPAPAPSAMAEAAIASGHTGPQQKVKNTNRNKSSDCSPKPCKIRAAVVTFDKEVQFYTVNMRSADPIKMFVCSSEDPFCPLPPDKWLMSVVDEDSALEHLLQRIPELIASMHDGTSSEALSDTGMVGGMRSYASFSSGMGGFGSNTNTPRYGQQETPRTPASSQGMLLGS